MPGASRGDAGSARLGAEPRRFSTAASGRRAPRLFGGTAGKKFGMSGDGPGGSLPCCRSFPLLSSLNAARGCGAGRVRTWLLEQPVAQWRPRSARSASERRTRKVYFCALSSERGEEGCRATEPLRPRCRAQRREPTAAGFGVSALPEM